MQVRNQASSLIHVKTLMNIAATLAECTQPPEHCAEIPAFLGRILELECMTLTVMRQTKDDPAPGMVFCYSSVGGADGEMAQAFRRCLPMIHQMAKTRMEEQSPEMSELYSDIPTPAPYVEIAVQSLVPYPRVLIFPRSIDAEHCMFLSVHRRHQEKGLDPVMADDIVMIGQELARQLHCLLVATTSPATLGKPFDRLSSREWIVLCGLNSDIGEKQLAEQIGLSPHTLHSHIKSIYRKFAVQGRLALLLRLNSAIHRMRMETLSLKGEECAMADEARRDAHK